MDKRSKAVRVLGLLPNDPQAEEVALHALKDDKPGVPAAAAQALGDMKANSDYSPLGRPRQRQGCGVIMAGARIG